MLPGLGNKEWLWDWLEVELCDMSRVLMTQMGFVTTVLLAPAMIDDQKLMNVGFSGYLVSNCVLRRTGDLDLRE